MRRLFLPIVLVWFATAAVRWWQFDDRRIISNIDASYHVLLTVRAMNATPASVHHFLPIVTLPRPFDREVPFGASVRGPDGNYYYTSFPPLGFVAPWAFFKATTLAPTLRNLLAFNLLLHLGATLLVVVLVGRIAEEEAARTFIAALAGLSYLLNFEAWWSHGPVYWHHSLFQLVWLAQLVAATSVLRAIDRGERWRRRDVLILVATALLGPSIEWAGYLSTAATACGIWWQSRPGQRRAALVLGGAMFVAAATAGLVFVAQIASAVGLGPAIASLRERAGTRSTAHGSFVALARGYVQSLGLLLALVGATLAAYVGLVRRSPPRWMIGVLILLAVPLFENVLLAEHATTYHFDRLKGLVTCLGVIVCLVPLLPTVWRDRMLFAWAAAVVTMVTRSPRPARVGDSVPPLSSNERLLREVRAAAKPCAVYATNGLPRGWAVLSVDANIYQSVPDVDSLRRIVTARGACQGVYLRVGLDLGETMYVWHSASLYDAATSRVDVLAGTPPRRPRLPARPEP